MKNIMIWIMLLLSITYTDAQNGKSPRKDYAKLANYDESKVPQYTLPSVLMCHDGEMVQTKEQWEQKRRPEILNLFTTYMFGKAPVLKHKLPCTVSRINEKALNGCATRKEITIQLTDDPQPGFGITVGNALRRILLSSLEGFAINTIKIEGVEHEFASVPGVKEDVTNIILNLKQVRFKQVVEEFENEKVSITVENSSEFKAGDISKYLTGFEVLNPELVICHLDSKATMQMDITINKGRGYVPADENREYCTDVNVIPIDSIYTPIRNVKYQVENFRVEQKTDYEKLVLEITTDGSIHPKEALKEAAKILIYHFMLFSDEKITLETSDVDGNEEFDEEVLHMRQLLKTKLVDMDLSVRALNCLKAADVETLGDLVQFNKTDLLKFRNFGKKSLTELDDLLEGLNLSFGTDISKYKLDKE